MSAKFLETNAPHKSLLLPHLEGYPKLSPILISLTKSLPKSMTRENSCKDRYFMNCLLLCFCESAFNERGVEHQS